MRDRFFASTHAIGLVAAALLTVATCLGIAPAVAQGPTFAWNAPGNIDLRPEQHTGIPYDPNNPGEYWGQLAELSPGELGYRGYRVAFQRTDLVPSDRDVPIDVRLSWQRYGSAFPPPEVVVRVVIPQGAVEGAADVFVPHFEHPYVVTFTTSVDGRRRPGLSGTHYRGYTSQQGRVSVLIGDQQTYDSLMAMTSVMARADFEAISNPAKSPRWTAAIAMSESQQSANTFNNAERAMHIAAAVSCPSERLAWSTVDQVIVEERVLEQLQPAQADALIEHVCAGARLTWFSRGELAVGRESAERWFAQKGIRPIASKWQQVNPNSAGYPTNFTPAAGGVRGEANVFGLGEVVVLPSGDIAEAVTGAAVGHAAFLNNTTRIVSGGPAEYIVDASRVAELQTISFWDWSLERLGRPPVLAFCALVGAFVGVLAPAVLFYSLRTGRPVLMLLLYPAIAAAGVATLAVYAIIKDGFQTHTRIRSVVMADAGGDAFAVSRQVLFSGMAPRGGLRFDAASEVIPIDPRGGSYGWSNQNGPAGVLQWTEDQQIYRGTVRSREQQQFLVLGPSPQQCPIEDVELGAAGEASRVRNALGSKIILLIICDGEGNAYAAEDVAAGTVATLRAVNPEECQKLIGGVEQTQPLAPPADLALTGGNGGGGGTFLFSGGSMANSGASGLTFDRYNSLVYGATNAERLKSTACYLAYMTDAPAIDLAVEGAVDEGSLHLVTGRWGAGQ